MPRSDIEEEVQQTKQLLAQLCVQLESVDSVKARTVLKDYQRDLQRLIKITKPKDGLHQLPPELLHVVIGHMLGGGGSDISSALAYLSSTCTFFSAGGGRHIILKECAKLCPALERVFTEDGILNENALYEYTGALLQFEEMRDEGDDRRPGPRHAMHTAFSDLPALGEALVYHEVQEARKMLAPLGFEVGEPTHWYEPTATLANGPNWNGLTKERLHMRVQCSVPGLPHTLHDGALHKCNLLFPIETGVYQDPATTAAEIYPWRPPKVYVRGEVYHCMLHGGSRELGKYASCCSRLLGSRAP